MGERRRDVLKAFARARDTLTAGGKLEGAGGHASHPDIWGRKVGEGAGHDAGETDTASTVLRGGSPNVCPDMPSP